MTIKTEWYGHHTDVIHIEVAGVWTWEEMEYALHQCNELFETVNYPVYTIFDFSQTRSIPDQALSHLKTLNYRSHPNSSTVLLVGLNDTYRMLLNVFTRLYGRLVNPYGVHILQRIDHADDLLIKLRSFHKGLKQGDT